MSKKIAVLGASGSVGRQALDVARARSYQVELLCANRDAPALEGMCREFMPRYAVMADESCARDLSTRLSDTGVKVLSGEDGITEAIHSLDNTTVVNAILGEAGLKPTLATIESGNRLALANKESLVIAGEIVMKAASEKGVEIIPVDSEHSAIFQSLKAGRPEEIKRLILTASGGPFYGKSREELRRVTLSDTLRHPTWKMGKKITVDSATLMNKGFEVIEAAHLFSVDVEKIKVLIHRESIVHSAVEYIDNSIIAELSVPDMRSCVQYAVDYPNRARAVINELDLASLCKLTFGEPDESAFPLLALAKRAIGLGGAIPAILNAADEIAVDAFLNEKISFTRIFEVVEETVEHFSKTYSKRTSLEEIISSDREARAFAEGLIK